MPKNEAIHAYEPTRREFLAAAGATALSGAGMPFGALRGDEKAAKKAPWAGEPRGPYAPFRMALQSYSLRKLDFQNAIDAVYDLRLGLVELWPGHLPVNLDEGELRRRLRAMRQNLLGRVAYGVVELTRSHEANRAVFEFASRLNLHALTASPEPESFDSLEPLVEEFGIAVAIHNHGPEDKRYGTPELLEKALKGRHKRIGLCVDTGHFLRVGVKPTDVVQAFGERVHAVHLKDVRSEDGMTTDVSLGEGDLDLVPFLRALKASGFKGGLALEHEADADHPVPAIQKCLLTVREAVQKL